MRAGLGATTLAVAGLALAGSAAPPGRGQDRQPGLCLVVRPIELLDCRNDRPPRRPDARAASAPSAPAAGEAPEAPPTAPAGHDAPAAALPTQAAQPTPLTPRYAPNLLMVRFRPGLAARRQAEVLAGAGVAVDHRIAALGVVVVRMPPRGRDAALARLRASPAVASAEKDALVDAMETIPNDTDWSYQWGLQRIRLPDAWDRTRGARVVVAVLDTGVDSSHADLAGAVLPGYDLTGSGTGSGDRRGHGTSAAGIIAARTNNREGIAGICWTCPILPVKVLGDDGQGTMDTLAAGIVKATDAGARVISMSLGGPASGATLDEAVRYAIAKNVVLVAAAGNNGTSSPFYPAASAGVVGVAATDETDRLYSWSNYGSWVRVAAPGCDTAPALGGSYNTFCGTSAAAPVVSGLIALALSLQPSLTSEQVVQAVTTTTDPVGTLPQGRIDASAALAALVPGATLVPGPQVTTTTFRGSLTPARSWRVHPRVARPGRVSASLSFTRGAWLTLSLVGSNNRVIAKVSGRTPLKLNRRVAAGAYWLGVAAARGARATYTLTVTGPS